MGKKQLPLIEKFPWIVQVFSAVLTVKTTTDILKSDGTHPLTRLIDTNFVFDKLIEVWDSNATKKQLTSVSQLLEFVN